MLLLALISPLPCSRSPLTVFCLALSSRFVWVSPVSLILALFPGVGSLYCLRRRVLDRAYVVVSRCFSVPFNFCFFRSPLVVKSTAQAQENQSTPFYLKPLCTSLVEITVKPQKQIFSRGLCTSVSCAIIFPTSVGIVRALCAPCATYPFSQRAVSWCSAAQAKQADPNCALPLPSPPCLVCSTLPCLCLLRRPFGTTLIHSIHLPIRAPTHPKKAQKSACRKPAGARGAAHTAPTARTYLHTHTTPRT